MAASLGHLQAGSQVIISEFCDTRLARESRPAYRPGMTCRQEAPDEAKMYNRQQAPVAQWIERLTSNQ
jgi:hypothetical protein